MGIGSVIVSAATGKWEEFLIPKEVREGKKKMYM